MAWPKKVSRDDGDKLYLDVNKEYTVLILESEPETYYTHFVNNKSTACAGAGCAICAVGEKRNEKGKIKIKDLADGKEKLLTGTAALFISLYEVITMVGGREGYKFKIKATGEKSQRRYTIVPLPLGQAMVTKEAPNPSVEEAEEDIFA